MTTQTTQPAITDRQRAIIEAILEARAKYTDHRSYPVYISIEGDDTYVMTFQVWEGYDRSDTDGYIRLDERPLFGSEDDGDSEVTVENYLSMYPNLWELEDTIENARS